MKTKKPDYRLRKDTPSTKAKAVFTWNQTLEKYECITPTSYEFFPASTVENSPEWFEKIEPKEYTRQDVFLFGMHIAFLRQPINMPIEFDKWKENRK